MSLTSNPATVRPQVRTGFEDLLVIKQGEGRFPLHPAIIAGLAVQRYYLAEEQRRRRGLRWQQFLVDILNDRKIFGFDSYGHR